MSRVLRLQMRDDLKIAMRQREKWKAETLRSLLAAIENAEAVTVVEPVEPSIGKTNDVPRRELSDDELVAIVRREHDERMAARDLYRQLDQEALAHQLEQEAGVIAAYLEQSA